MALRWLVRPNTYHDSVKLLRVSEELARQPGVTRAAAVMATPLNVELLAADGLLPPEVRTSPEDLLVAVLAAEEQDAEEALHALDRLLAPRQEAGERDEALPRTLEAASTRDGANLAVIAIPGQYAAAEAFAALRADMHVFLFSDNVAIEDEVNLKRLAAETDLLMMGPDCGTAILDGVGLGFANRVGRGPVGIVGASGTGIQQVCCLLDLAGVGVAQAIGTGGRDLSAEVGGSMTRRALHLLEADARVEVIAVISKPADAGVAARLHAEMASLSKPVVACLLGEAPENRGSVRYAATLTDAAALITGALGETLQIWGPGPIAGPNGGSGVYGLFAGGTLQSEAARILNQRGVSHHLVDLGADEYTRGRAHPIIDPRLRVDMLADLAGNPDVGALLLDIILGDLAAADPAAALAPAIVRLAERGIPVMATLIGARTDPQGLERQRAVLEEAGATVFASNAHAAAAAGALVGVAA